MYNSHAEYYHSIAFARFIAHLQARGEKTNLHTKSAYTL